MTPRAYPGYGLEPYTARRTSSSSQARQYVSLADRYVRVRGIGQGGEGVVILMRSIDRGDLRVMKTIQHSNQHRPPREVRMLEKLGMHRNIVKMFEAEYDPASGRANLSLEYAVGGDLAGLIKYWHTRGIQAPAAMVLHAMVQIGEALAFMHGSWVRCNRCSGYHVSASPHCAIVHSDVKPQNILIRFPGHKNGLPDFVLADLGMSFQYSHEDRYDGGTTAYYAPEYFYDVKLPLDAKIDTYAYGVTMLRLCQGHDAPLFRYCQCPHSISLPQHLRGFGITRFLKSCLLVRPDQRIDMDSSRALDFLGFFSRIQERCQGLDERFNVCSEGLVGRFVRLEQL